MSRDWKEGGGLGGLGGCLCVSSSLGSKLEVTGDAPNSHLPLFPPILTNLKIWSVASQPKSSVSMMLADALSLVQVVLAASIVTRGGKRTPLVPPSLPCHVLRAHRLPSLFSSPSPLLTLTRAQSLSLIHAYVLLPVDRRRSRYGLCHLADPVSLSHLPTAFTSRWPPRHTRTYAGRLLAPWLRARQP